MHQSSISPFVAIIDVDLYRIPVVAGDCPLLAKFIREKRQTISLTLIMVTGREGLIVTPSKSLFIVFYRRKAVQS